MSTTLELTEYYARLLIVQYINKLRASATIKAQVAPVLMPQVSTQTLTFSAVATSGTYVLTYDEDSSAAINWNDSESTIQTKLRAVDGLSDVTVAVDGLVITVTFVNVYAPALLLEVASNTLSDGVDPVTITVLETDVTLPFAVQDGFNLLAPTAVGVQLDVLGKYAGVSRTGQGFSTQITLTDADYLSLIRMAILTNSADSDLATIQDLIFLLFPNEIRVFDYKNMRMSYLISTAVGSSELVQLFVVQGLLPKPMAVQVATVIFAPDINMFFGFRTYQLPAFNTTPFNTYADYEMDRPWLSYSDALEV